jgi:AcrR family transcriptional regulator
MGSDQLMATLRNETRAATARERARAELTREIKEEARRQLAASGADGLSLRAVARELGMVSSALYRYYPSRDDLLTALIIDAYDVLGEAAERAIAGTVLTAGTGPAAGAGLARERWIAACHAVRGWARSNPHEYALIYGSPVPGYRAPEATIAPAARVPLALIGIVRDALSAGELTARQEALPVAGALAEQASALSAALARSTASPGPAAGDPGAADIPPDSLVRAVIAWTQLFGMISFELFGQFVGSFEPADALFAHTVLRLGAFVGLPEGGREGP